jgi:hypothetical protein
MELQVFELVGCQLKQEIVWETIEIAPHRLVEFASFDTIECRKIPVKYDLLTSDLQDNTLDSLIWNKRRVRSIDSFALDASGHESIPIQVISETPRANHRRC